MSISAAAGNRMLPPVVRLQQRIKQPSKSPYHLCAPACLPTSNLARIEHHRRRLCFPTSKRPPHSAFRNPLPASFGELAAPLALSATPGKYHPFLCSENQKKTKKTLKPNACSGECGDGRMRMPIEPGKKIEITGLFHLFLYICPVLRDF
jgi:hypothetical protein